MVDSTWLPPERTRTVEGNEQVVNNSPKSTSLARRIMSWSGNLLATCVIVILGLTFGKQVLHWWHGDPPVVAIETNDLTTDLHGIGDPQRSHLLAFGDLPLTLDRTVFEGDEAAAMDQLRANCKRVAIASAAKRQKAIPASANLLRRLEEYEPVEQGEGWRIVQNAGPVITVVALQMAANEPPEEVASASQRAASVLSWAVGLRGPTTTTETASPPDRWTLFTCSGQSTTVDSDLGTSLPIPPECRRTMSVGVSKGGALVGFSGRGTATTSMQFYDRSLAGRGWKQVRTWQRIGGGWHARFQKVNSATCDIQITDNSHQDHARVGDTARETSGILTLTSAARISEN